MSQKMLRIIVWRIISVILSFLITRIFSGSWHFALGLVFTSSIVLTTTQAIFEHFWDLKFKKETKNVQVVSIASPTSPDAAGNEFT